MSEAVVSPSPGPGWFGKMPYVGDFVSRRLPDDFIRAWDDWLQSGMARARADLGAAWPARYLVAPVRRFWLAPRLLGDTGWAGALMPSVDGVGRYFPLTIAAALPDHTLAAVLAASAWFRAIDAAGRKVLDVNFSADDLDAELAQVAPLPAEVPADLQVQRLAATWLAPHRPQTISLWWCGDAMQAAQFHCFGALPPPGAFGSLLLAPDDDGCDL
ncbi:type VI secretion system-associated protein TagF [Rhizobacter sp. Root1221]|uniref:type VI secretion system-associated protein TagF n=1 Tax=Rhizobacter sp. Root1221 TaxID=1736433 RepID=UPI0012F89F07|nr:type VI secretion system-associated protein TagF [Rhizobacter sp. Root1221]